MEDYVHKQTKDKPLYPDLLWSRPEQTSLAGKLLIIGGNVHGFAAPAEAYQAATKAGIGTIRILLPDSLQKTVGKILLQGEYAPSTPSGSFGRNALAMLLEMSNWADGVLLAGDFARNSETAILLEQFITKYQGQLTLTKDTADYFLSMPNIVLDRQDTTLVIAFAQLQKLAMHAHFDKAFTFEMDYLRLVSYLHEFSEKTKAALIVKHLDTIFVAYNGQVSTTKVDSDIHAWRVRTAAQAATWQIQNPKKVFAALTMSVLEGE
jgi:hypothetical protein